MIPVQEAVDLIIAQAKSFGKETISIKQALGRVLAQDVAADRDYPPFNRATMDGFAVQAADFQESKPARLHIIENLFAGGEATATVTAGTCIKIMTGAPLPEGADAVIRIEDCQVAGKTVSFREITVSPGQNIARRGEDAQQGDILIQHNQWIDAAIISGLAVTGYANLQVEKLPRVAIISTGNEIIQVGKPVLTYQIRDSNSFSIKSYLKTYHIHPDSQLVLDNKEALAATIRSYLEKDMIILSGGVSKGDADYVPEVLESLGVKQIFHRVKIKPGAPLWFGTLPSGGVVFGLPGNPVSVQVACRLFIEPYLRTCFGLQLRQPITLPFLANRIKKTKFDEYFPCKIVSATPFSGILPQRYNGSGDIAVSLGSDGIFLHPEQIDTLEENTPVQIYLW